MPATPRTVRAFHRIMESSLFRLNGPEIDVPDALIELADAVHHEPADNDSWLYLGEGLESDCSDLIVGAYWAMAHWHGGQNSPEYAALCTLGKVFKPGMACEPNEDDNEYPAYAAIGAHYKAKSAAK